MQTYVATEKEEVKKIAVELTNTASIKLPEVTKKKLLKSININNVIMKEEAEAAGE